MGGAWTLNMIKEELKSILRNKIAMITLFGLMLVPFLYTFFFLKSVWDPYGKTDNLPVAVVNKDQAVTFRGQHLNVGKDLVKNMKESKGLKWDFVSQKEADYGLRHRKYYITITIPKDFSKNATTVLDKHPKKMNLHYEANESLNYIGSIIGKNGVKEIGSRVRNEVATTYADTMIGVTKKLGKGMDKAAKGAGQLSDGSTALKDGMYQYTAGVKQVNNGLIEMQVSVKPLKAGVNALATGANQLGSGLNTLNGKTGELASGVNKLYQGSGQVTTGAKALHTGLITYTNGVFQVNQGVGQLNSKTDTLAGGIGKLATGANGLQDGINQYTGTVAGLLAKFNSQSGQLDQLKALPQATSELNKYMTQLNDSVQKIDPSQFATMLATMNKVSTQPDQMAQLVNQLPSTTEIQQLQTQLAQAGKQTEAAGAGLNQAIGAANASKSDIADAKTKINAVMNSDKLDDSQKQSLQAAVAKLDDASGKQDGISTGLQTIASNLKQQSQVSSQELNKLAGSLTTLANSKQNIEDMLTTAKGMTGPEMQKQLKDLGDQLTALKSATGQLQAGSSQLASKTAGLDTEVNQLESQLKQGGSKIGSANTKLNAGAKGLANGLNTLNGKVPELKAGIGQIYAGTQQLAGNSGQLLSGSSQLANGSSQVTAGLGQLNGQVPVLVNAIQLLAAGGNQLSSGLNELNAKVPTLEAGVNALANGTQQLVDNSGKLEDGASQLADGSDELSTSLQKGSDGIKALPLSKRTGKMMGNPVKLSKKNYAHVQNYGHALAPYMMSVSLFVLALAFNIIYPIKRLATADGTPTDWFFSKAIVATFVAVGAALIDAGIMYTVGLVPLHHGEFFLNTIQFALLAMFLVMLFSLLFGNPGRFIVLILLVFQLGGAGGTFPIQITTALNGFYQAINPYLPMTYSVYGFREALNGGFGSAWFIHCQLVMIAITVVCLLLIWVSMHWLRHSGKVSYVGDIKQDKDYRANQHNPEEKEDN